MEKYRKLIEKRVRLLGAGLTLGAAILAVCSQLSGRYAIYPSGFAREFMTGFPAGLAAGWVGLVVFMIVRYNTALKNEARLREMKVKEEDERMRLIREKAGGFGFNLTLCALMLMGIAACFLNITVAFTLFATALGMSLLKGGLKLYYFRRY